MLVKECMSRRIETIAGAASIGEAATRMRDANVGSLVVVEAERFVGIVTDRDLVVRGLAHGSGPTATVRALMTRGLATCFVDDDVRAAARAMAAGGVRRLLVLDRDMQPVGLLSVDDLALHDCAPELLATVLGHPV